MSERIAPHTVLAGDIGGTKTLLSVSGPGVPNGAVERRYASADFPTFDGLLADFLAEIASVVRSGGRQPGGVPTTLSAAALALAGPVHRQRCRITNLPWTFDAAALSTALGGRPVVLLNDFEAVGHAMPCLTESQTATIQSGEAEADAPIALLGAGTGLGEAMVLPDGPLGSGRVRVIAGEGGHADLAAQSPLEDAYLTWLRARHGAHVSWERVLSGAGLGAGYTFLAERTPERVDPTTAAAMTGEDPAAVVTARADVDPLCDAALDLFLGIYGAEAGNCALRCMARGGVMLAGGIAPRLLDHLARPDGAFRRAFRAKGRFEPFLATVPIRVVLETRVGLLGAAAAATALAETAR